MNIDLLPQEDLLIQHRYGEPRFYMRPEEQAAHPHFHYQYELTRGSFLFISNLENHFIYSHDEGFERYAFRFSSHTAELMRNPVLLSLFRQRPNGFSHLYQCQEKELPHYQRLFQNMEREYSAQKPCWSQMLISTFLILLSGIYRKSL